MLTGSAGRYSGSIELPGGAYDVQLLDPEQNWRFGARTSGKPATLTLSAAQRTQR
jgi:hypothetical protein